MQLVRILTFIAFFLGGPFQVFSQIYGEEIIQWDFENGIPETFENTSMSGVGLWEYRGPSTEPNNSVCSQGSCGIGSIPIASESLTNGFVIFDSNYWDDSEGPCGNLGSGLDPGPHEAHLTTESVNLTGIFDVVLTFQQQYKHFLSSDYDVYTFVEISIDGGNTYETIYENPGNYAVSAPAEWASVNISAIAGGQPDVKFKFSFTGFYYWWCLDDITLYVPNEDDLMIANPKYTQYNGALDPNGFGDLEYHSYPQSLIPEFNFSADAVNIGADAQSGCRINIDIQDQNQNSVYSDMSSPLTILAGNTTNLTIPTPYLPSGTLGEFEILYEITQDQLDLDLPNNYASKNFEITEYEFSRDEGFVEDQFFPAPQFIGETVEIGNLFHVWETGLKIHSVSVVVGDATDAGNTIYANLYDMTRDSIFAFTEPYVINAWDISQLGEEKIINLPFTVPILSCDTTVYLPMVGDSIQGDGEFRIGRSGTPPVQSSLVGYPESNNLFYLLTTAMVRLNIFPADSNPGCTDDVAMNYDGDADIDDGSCKYPGCTNSDAPNFDPSSNYDDGSCIFYGCTDPEADNFDEIATIDDGSCIYLGCTNPNAENYDPEANEDDGSCIVFGCTDSEADNYDPDATDDDGSCFYLGCTDPEADNYDPTATVEDGSCLYYGCIDPYALNYDSTANADDGSCVYDEAFVSTSTLDGCAPLTLIVFNQTNTAPDGVCLFTWGDGQSFDQCDDSFEIVLDTPGEYTITYIYTINGNNSEATSEIITVYDVPPTPVLTFNEETLEITCTCDEADLIEWYLNDELITSTGEIIVVDQNGFYSVVITDSNGCQATSEAVNVSVISVENFDGYKTAGIEIYPNPADQWFVVNSSFSGLKLSIFDASGSRISEASFNSFSARVLTSDLPSGSYVVVIDSGGMKVFRHLLIQH